VDLSLLSSPGATRARLRSRAGPLRGGSSGETSRTARAVRETEATVGVVSKRGVARSGGRASQARKLFKPLEEGIVAETRWTLRTPGQNPVELDRDTPPSPVRNGNCSFCQAEIGGDLELTVPGFGKHGQRTSASSFCSAYCRDSVLALAALHPSPLASSDFIAKRALLTDRLLDLWRHGQGPDPALVLQAAETASCGLDVADASNDAH
jgi:hypothetical protein